jgi:hypothetical protein
MSFKPSLCVTRHAEGTHVIGRERDLLRFHWLDFLARFAPILNVNMNGP